MSRKMKIEMIPERAIGVGFSCRIARLSNGSGCVCAWQAWQAMKHAMQPSPRFGAGGIIQLSGFSSQSLTYGSSHARTFALFDMPFEM